jgi:hypothetical protein
VAHRPTDGGREGRRNLPAREGKGGTARRLTGRGRRARADSPIERGEERRSTRQQSERRATRLDGEWGRCGSPASSDDRAARWREEGAAQFFGPSVRGRGRQERRCKGNANQFLYWDGTDECRMNAGWY